MLDWLIGDCCDLLGVTVQNWIVVFAVALIIYAGALYLTRRRGPV